MSDCFRCSEQPADLNAIRMKRGGFTIKGDFKNEETPEGQLGNRQANSLRSYIFPDARRNRSGSEVLLSDNHRLLLDERTILIRRADSSLRRVAGVLPIS